MKGVTSTVAIIILLLISIALAGLAWAFLSGYLGAYTSKTIVIPIGGGFCGIFNSAEIIIQNAGTDIINLADPPKTEFGKIGNDVPNSGFELDADNNNKPDFWGKEDTEAESADVVLVTDLSNSMSDCMDSKEITPDMDTVLLLHFNDGTASDSGGNNIVTTLEGNAKIIGKALVLDGNNSYLKVKDDPALDLNGDFSIEFLAKFTSGYSYFFSKGFVWDLPYAINTWGQDGVAWGVRINNSYYYEDQHALPSIKDGLWHHYLFQRSGSKMILYIDGIKNNEFDASSEGLANNYDLKIGYSRGNYGNYFNGSIDEFAIYSRALSDEEIKSHAMVLDDECPPDRPDGGDMPSWCRYETALCPAPGESIGEETYFTGARVDGFKKVAYSKIPGSEPGLSCTLKYGCDSSICENIGKVYNGTTVYGSDVIKDSCETNECQNGYSYSDCALIPRTDQGYSACGTTQYDAGDITTNSECKAGCVNPPVGEKPAGGCDCTWIGRSVCSMSACGASQQDEGDNSIFAWRDWRDECLSTECNTGATRHTTYECTEGLTCSKPGYTKCSECDPSCQSFETCCCRDDSLQYKCEQKQDNCCNKRVCEKYSDNCCTTRKPACRTIQQWCCEPLYTCMPNLPGNDTGHCTPGLMNGKPRPESNCGSDSGVWQCRAEGGGCYICDSVAIRLAKKLDYNFVNSLFSFAKQSTQPNSVRIGLVSYGEGMGLSEDLMTQTGQHTLIEDITYYDANAGETCISCAVEKAIETLDSPPDGNKAEKRYVVLMSDGDANMCRGGRRNGESGCNAKQEAINLACNYNTNNPNDMIIFYTVGFGKDAGASTLKAIAQCSGGAGRYFQGESPQELANIYEEISQRIGNAGLTTEEKKYGERAMLLTAAQDLPIATSDIFDIYPEPGEEYALWFYRKLDLKEGVKLNVTVYFYDRDLNFKGLAWKDDYQSLMDSEFYWERILIDIPPDSAKASIQFRFTGDIGLGGAGGGIKADDVYFGPPVSCIKEGESYRCGDLLVIKMSQDGEMYPYFNHNPLNPMSSVILKDANCKGDCRYKIVSGTSVAEASASC